MRELPSTLILYNLPNNPDKNWNVSASGKESREGIIDEINVITGGLDKSGTPYRKVGITRLSDVPAILASAREPVIWNLIEGLTGDPQDASFIPALCCSYGKIATGCDSPCLTLTLDKWRTKAVLREAGIPVPEGMIVPVGAAISRDELGKGPFIIKPSESDASEGIESGSVFQVYEPAMDKAVKVIHEQFNQPVLIEKYVGTRELNISVIQDGNNIKIMPIAEIDFSGFEPGRPRIVDYAAKWLKDTFEYKNTSRIIPALVSEEVAGKIRTIVLKTWQTLECQDFIRVDMRMDDNEQIYVLEVNANPDISPDAGFAAALAAGSITTEKFVRMVICNAMERLHLRQTENQKIMIDDINHGDFTVRYTILKDRDEIIRFTETTGYFRPDEIDIACEVLDDALVKGPEGHYQSFTAESEGKAIGWICFGPTPCTLGTYDIYWIVVAPSYQRKGIGFALMNHAEKIIRDHGGRLSVIETSGKCLYESTRDFYHKMGYSEQARVAEFYTDGDDKVIYTKQLIRS
ncbi:MAG: GNAT family N-acetyltransferase [Kiritimatiellae bacterium]|nr:GNAT family N-acetyltransferase [Kiritimatiellia bacterium]MDD5519362.1 GNAT family N-acetyltransferase [Kiritimatiellia bacterium]